jgi:hypothetical protein
LKEGETFKSPTQMLSTTFTRLLIIVSIVR